MFIRFGLKKIEMPLAEIVERGLDHVYEAVTAENMEYKYSKDYSNLRIHYTLKKVTLEEIAELTDDDVLHVYADKRPTKEEIEELEQAAEKTKVLAVAFRRLADKRDYGYNMIFGEPSHMTKIIKKNPHLIRNTKFLAILKSWPLFKAYCVKDEYAHDPKRNDFKDIHYHRFVQKFIPNLARHYGVDIVNRGGQENGATVPAHPTLAITQVQLQNALQAAMANLAPAPANRVPSPPPRAPASNQPSTSSAGASSSNASSSGPSSSNAQPFSLDFTEQAETIRSFGFVDDVMIQLALEQTGGQIQEAVEFLLSLNN